mmetsp:Transcript_13334/g.23416  ORF Transcript_13334/g.23416 Transcript_13334/m.23416 type:complete len:142 (+) Transcript_13334:176-601(+)
MRNLPEIARGPRKRVHGQRLHILRGLPVTCDVLAGARNGGAVAGDVPAERGVGPGNLPRNFRGSALAIFFRDRVRPGRKVEMDHVPHDPIRVHAEVAEGRVPVEQFQDGYSFPENCKFADSIFFQIGTNNGIVRFRALFLL